MKRHWSLPNLNSCKSSQVTDRGGPSTWAAFLKQTPALWKKPKTFTTTNAVLLEPPSGASAKPSIQPPPPPPPANPLRLSVTPLYRGGDQSSEVTSPTVHKLQAPEAGSHLILVLRNWMLFPQGCPRPQTPKGWPTSIPLHPLVR